MPKRGRSRVLAVQQLETTAEVTDLDYLGGFLKRKRPNDDSNDRNSTFRVPIEQLDDRTVRRVRREADKLGQPLQVQDQRVSPLRENVQLSGEDNNEDENGDSAEEEEGDNEDEEWDGDGGADGVDHDRITQAMNEARKRTVKPTINGIGSLQRNNQPRRAGELSDNRGDSQELFSPQSPEGDNANVPRNTNIRSRGGHGAKGKEPRQQKQRSQKDRGRPTQETNTNTQSTDEDESEAESSTEIDDQGAEDTAFVEAPQEGEETETVKVVIHSMGGILKTLQLPAWTGLTRFERDFGSEDDDDGQKACKTRSGRALMEELQGLNNILGEATGLPEESSEDDYDIPSAAIAFLRTKSLDVQQHLIRMDKIVDEICRRKLIPAPRTAKKKKAMLRDLSQRLIPMLVITVKKACGICPSEVHRARTTLHLDCFRLQFLLRPLGWADRLHQAFERCLKQETSKKSQTDADDPDKGGSKVQDLEKARETFGSQLNALLYACKKAEKEIQDKAAQAERLEREAEVNRQDRERRYERQKELDAKNKREQEQQQIRDERQMQAFIRDTHALRFKDPMKDRWSQSQALLPDRLRAASTVRAAPGGSLGLHGQSMAGAARSQGGPYGNAQAQPRYQSEDPFEDNYRHRRPWSEDDKAMIRAIRYKQDFDVVSMAHRLGRSEDEVARQAAFLKQGYREYFTQKGAEIPAWAW